MGVNDFELAGTHQHGAQIHSMIRKYQICDTIDRTWKVMIMLPFLPDLYII
jgi:hypothetical protein